MAFQNRIRVRPRSQRPDDGDGDDDDPRDLIDVVRPQPLRVHPDVPRPDESAV